MKTIILNEGNGIVLDLIGGIDDLNCVHPCELFGGRSSVLCGNKDLEGHCLIYCVSPKLALTSAPVMCINEYKIRDILMQMRRNT